MASASGSLARYVVQRLLLIIPMVFLLTTIVFLLLRVAPGDPVSATVGGRLSEDALNSRRAALGLDRPLLVQYLEYLKDVATLNFGQTITDNRAIIDIVQENGGATLTLSVAAFLVALIIGLPLGLLAGRVRDTFPDLVIRIFGVVTYAAPVFYWGLLFQLFFAGRLGWFPASGAASPRTIFEVEEVTHILLVDALISGNMEAVLDVLEHLVLPAMTLGLLLSGIFIRLVRVNVIQSLQGDYVEAARARGIPERRVMRTHAFRNALVPVVTVIGLQVALLLSGAILTEATFNWPGLGNELVQYINNRDYAAVQGIITLFAVVVVVVSILIDIVNALIDPRVRY
ncbi:ABC transporter permease [Nocardioides sp. SYSU DS0663]|uniref:ABC transporter permease n=1 Tax=Nocardioides sp. SYSU DS0663 TaxID=3416445 RepID=UPI003F4B29DA